MEDKEWKNKLYFGDNLAILREHVPDESVDLVYLDPPFNSKATYNVLFSEKNGTESAAQITAFEDTWHWGIESEAAYHEVVTGGGKLADLLGALRQFLGANDMMAYLTMMAIRLQELHRVLKSTGSIYLHCDPTANHYLKLLMDAVFSPRYFLNEITWKRTHSHSNVGRNFGSICDTLLVYTKSGHHVWNQLYSDFSTEYIERTFKHRDPDGRRWQSPAVGAVPDCPQAAQDCSERPAAPGRPSASNRGQQASVGAGLTGNRRRVGTPASRFDEIHAVSA